MSDLSTDEIGEYAWALISDSGHLDCGAWQYDEEMRRLACTCGVIVAEGPEKAGRVTPEQAILAAIVGHQTYAFTGGDDLGFRDVDEFAQCKCQACGIARSAHIGFAECLLRQREVYQRLADSRSERQRARYAAMFPDPIEVPF